MPDQDDFHFEQDGHIYTNKGGVMRPSVTQCLKLGGVFDYSMVPPELLERKRVIGTNVHAWTADYDRYGSSDPTTITEEEYGYAYGWVRFVKHMQPKFLAIEEAMLREVAGMEVGGTPDRIALINNRAWVIDLKCTSAHHPGWRLQTALYEMLYTERPYIGGMARMAVRLTPSGKYILNNKPYDNTADATAAIAFLQGATWLSNENLLPRPMKGTL